MIRPRVYLSIEGISTAGVCAIGLSASGFSSAGTRCRQRAARADRRERASVSQAIKRRRNVRAPQSHVLRLGQQVTEVGDGRRDVEGVLLRTEHHCLGMRYEPKTCDQLWQVLLLRQPCKSHRNRDDDVGFALLPAQRGPGS